MYSILTVTTAATNYDLTKLADVKDELGITNGASDAVLNRYISSASQAAMQYCNRIFAIEAVSEQFLADRPNGLTRGGVRPLQLSRWPLVASSTVVTEDSVVLVENTDYLADNVNGQLTRLGSSGSVCCWHSLPLTIAYSAGYATPPLDVADAIIRMITKRYSAKGRDSTLKAENIPGVVDRQFWIATGEDAANMTPDVADILNNYRVPVIS